MPFAAGPVFTAAGEDGEKDTLLFLEVSDQPHRGVTELNPCCHTHRRVKQLNGLKEQMSNKCGIQNHNKEALNV